MLVGTTVIEVGVDVPEATMMIVEDADRFGLAQLHQLRGRVGRGTAASFCVLVSDSADEVARARLEAVRTTSDGFVLAEKDLELRQEGDVLGLTQSGLPRLRIASLARREDQALAVAARRHAEAALDRAVPARARGTSSAPAGSRASSRPSPPVPRSGGRVADGGRVIAGSAAGLRLLAPGPATRPLADRVKQTLFAILEPDLPGAAVLDLFAGSGAAGIEALSRGAARAVFVDRDAAAVRTIRANLDRTGLGDRADVRAGRRPRVPAGRRGGRPVPSIS